METRKASSRTRRFPEPQPCGKAPVDGSPSPSRLRDSFLFSLEMGFGSFSADPTISGRRCGGPPFAQPGQGPAAGLPKRPVQAGEERLLPAKC